MKHKNPNATQRSALSGQLQQTTDLKLAALCRDLRHRTETMTETDLKSILGATVARYEQFLRRIDKLLSATRSGCRTEEAQKIAAFLQDTESGVYDIPSIPRAKQFNSFVREARIQAPHLVSGNMMLVSNALDLEVSEAGKDGIAGLIALYFLYDFYELAARPLLREAAEQLTGDMLKFNYFCLNAQEETRLHKQLVLDALDAEANAYNYHPNALTRLLGQMDAFARHLVGLPLPSAARTTSMHALLAAV